MLGPTYFMIEIFYYFLFFLLSITLRINGNSILMSTGAYPRICQGGWGLGHIFTFFFQMLLKIQFRYILNVQSWTSVCSNAPCLFLWKCRETKDMHPRLHNDLILKYKQKFPIARTREWRRLKHFSSIDSSSIRIILHNRRFLVLSLPD